MRITLAHSTKRISFAAAVFIAGFVVARDGEPLTGPWDAGNVHSGVDGTQVRFYKGSVSVQLMTSAADAAAKTTLIAIAKRIGGGL